MNDDEPIVKVEIPDPPDHLTQDQQNVFAAMAAKLARMKIMSDVDVDALCMYSVAEVERREAQKRIEEMGLMVKAPKSGVPMHNPFLGIRDRAEKRALAMLLEFGMTPSSRTRVKQK